MTESSPLLTIWNDLSARLAEAGAVPGVEGLAADTVADNVNPVEDLIRRMGLDVEDVTGFVETVINDAASDAAAAGPHAVMPAFRGVATFALLAGVALERQDRGA